MKIIITGANGIIGRQLVSKILNSYSNLKILVLERKESVIKHVNITSLKMDLLKSNSDSFNDLIKKFQPDLFFHLAWNTNHSDYLTSSENKDWETTSKLLIDAFYSNGGKKFIGLGSSIEYDWSYNSPLIENITPYSKEYEYSKSKLSVLKYLKSKEKDFLWGRVFFVFGSNQSDTRLIPKIISNALTGIPELSIVGDIERDYLSTNEIANQIILMEHANYNGEFNVCSGQPIKLQQIVDLVSKITNKSINLKNNNYDGPLKSKTVFGSLKKLNEYYPKYVYSIKHLEADLRLTIKSFKDIIHE
ncbi:NAD-dependent epimerase/dehydratase family protein [Flavobacteriaceae bacterium]|nr:NAD-dependent epimerase/dehydratase family protein [Flavobacteriaceae bacterium]